MNTSAIPQDQQVEDPQALSFMDQEYPEYTVLFDPSELGNGKSIQELLKDVLILQSELFQRITDLQVSAQ